MSYIVVCRGPHCRERGSRSLRQRLVQLVRAENNVELLGYACFGQCENGPNVMFYEEQAWYGGLSEADSAERVLDHAARGAPMGKEPLVLPDGERQDHLRNIAELIQTRLHDAESAGMRWWNPFTWRTPA